MDEPDEEMIPQPERNPPSPGNLKRGKRDGPVGGPSLADQLCASQLERWRAGERVAVEDYLARQPELRDDPEAQLELIYGEYLVRESLGESPRPEEYLGRFPEFAERLRRLLAIHRALSDEPSDHSLKVRRMP